MNWVEKYKPKKTSEIIGQDTSIKKIIDFILNFKKQKKKALLIYGPPGSGKTSSIYAIANELNLELLELNASHFRNQENIKHIIGNASTQLSLFNKSKLILIDELEGISGTKDRGALSEIIEVMEKTSFPIILITNSIEPEKLDSLKKKSETVEFKKIEISDIFKFLKKICQSESISFKEEDLKKLASYSNNDLRGAILDLQLLCYHTKKLKLEDIEEVAKREKRFQVEEALNVILKGSNLKDSLRVIEDLDEDVLDLSSRSIYPVIFSNDNCLSYWLDENIPRVYSNSELEKAFYYMSKADVFRGRIFRWQHWRFITYIQTLYASISIAKDKKNPTMIKYRKTNRSPKQNFFLWRLVSKRKDIVAEKIALQTHSSKRASYLIIPYLRIIMKKHPKDLINYFDFDEKDLEWLNS